MFFLQNRHVDSLECDEPPLAIEDLLLFVADIQSNENSMYKYYCPLCMNYFKSILTCQCCGNYCCYYCSQNYLISKKVPIFTIQEMLDHSKLQTVPCPNCTTTGFKLSIVDHSAVVRNYSQSISDIPQPPQSSPIQIGDSFENLKRKMIMFPCQKERLEDTVNNHNDDFGEAFIENPNLVTSMEISPENDEIMPFNDDIDEAPAIPNHSDGTMDTCNIELLSGSEEVPEGEDFGVRVSYLD